MRQVVLDTETTGLDPKNGDRVIEIGCVELIDRTLTGRHYHTYLNPGRSIDAGAQAVHGLSEAFLADKPVFAQVVDEFSDFVRGAELIIHNAPFDLGFLNMELARLGRGNMAGLAGGVIDTLKMAREMNPGKKASLDALCERFEINNAHRTLHGALLDSEILAEVYLAMTRGQDTLLMGFDDDRGPVGEPVLGSLVRGPLPILRASAEERAAHEAVLAEIAKASQGACLWRNA